MGIINEESRRPILINRQTVALISIYKVDQDILDSLDCDMETFNDKIVAKDGAKEFIRQFKDWWTREFMENLVKEIINELKRVG